MICNIGYSITHKIRGTGCQRAILKNKVRTPNAWKHIWGICFSKTNELHHKFIKVNINQYEVIRNYNNTKYRVIESYKLIKLSA